MKFIRRAIRILYTIHLAMIVVSFYTLITSFQGSVLTKQEQQGLSLLQILPAITFLLAIITGALNLYVMNKLAKTKEEILIIVRSEFSAEITKLTNSSATKQDVEYLRREMSLMLKGIEDKIDMSARRDAKNDQR